MTPLTSNGLPLPFTPRYLVHARDSAPLLARPDALRERYERDGFLWLRGVLDPASVWTLRGRYFSAFDDGYLAAGTAPEQGIFSGTRPPGLAAHGVAGHPAFDFVRSEPFLGFVSSPELRRLAETVLGGACWQLPRRILRHFDRSTPAASRAHADYSYLDQGADRLVTMWIPLGDCPLDSGGLVYLAGSHRLGPEVMAPLRARTDRPGDARPLSHDLAWVSDQLELPWSWADYRAGDVAVHSPHVVHASLDTRSDFMRASIDVRFVADGEPVDPRWLQEWSGDDGN